MTIIVILISYHYLLIFCFSLIYSLIIVFLFRNCYCCGHSSYCYFVVITALALFSMIIDMMLDGFHYALVSVAVLSEISDVRVPENTMAHVEF